MSATMARQAGHVQVEQSDMCLALNMSNKAKGGLLHAVMELMQYLITKSRTEVRDEKSWGVKFPEHTKVMAAIDRHVAMLCQNQMDGCLSCPNGCIMNPLIRWRHRGIGVPAPNQHTHLTPELTPPRPETPILPGTTFTPAGNNTGAQRSEIVNLPVGYVYSHPSHSCANFSSLDSSA
jgi:hypothetical protein